MSENYFGITDPGRQRKNNEDRFIAKAVSKNQFIIACVIDGVGGYAGGEVAAQLTSDGIIHDLEKLEGNIIDQLISALSNANEKILKEKRRNPQNEKMACVVTLAVVDINKNVFYFAHVGDTRLYLFRDGSLIKVTRDHSTVGFLEESGRLTEEAAMQHPKRNEVNKALGYETQIPLTRDFIDTGESPFLPGDIILLCSDGLSDMLPANKMIAVLNNRDDLPAKCRLLVNAANDAGGKDNITVVLVRNGKAPVLHEVTKPANVLKKNNHNGDGEPKTNPQTDPASIPVLKDGPGKNINPLLLFFCVIFFLGFAWLLFKELNKNKPAENFVPPIVPKQRNKGELELVDSINASRGKILTLKDSQPIVITEAILIKNDSLHITGKGISLLRDSAYTGPAFILSSNCKYILLDSLVLENFDVGVLVLNKGLHLKNVRFKECRVPLQFEQQFTQSIPVSGAQAQTIFYYADSLHK